MKFTNAYELFKTLYDRDFLKGFYIKQAFMLSGIYNFSLFQIKSNHDNESESTKIDNLINSNKDELFKNYLENYPLDFTLDLDPI